MQTIRGKRIKLEGGWVLSCSRRASLVAQMVKNLPAMPETWVRSLGWEIPWRRAWQPTPVFLPGESQWTEEPGRLQSLGLWRVRHDWVTNTFTFQCANSVSFVSSFQIWISWFSFYCLMDLDRTTKTKLNKSGERRHFCLVSNFRGKAFSFLESSMSAVYFSYGLNYVEMQSFYTYFVKEFFL